VDVSGEGCAVSAAPACAVLAVAWLLAGSALAADVGTARQLEQARAAAAEILQRQAPN